MKSKAILLFLTITLITYGIHAQETSTDSQAIESSILNYIENFFENNFEEMNTSLHPRLAKRGLNPDGTLSDDFPPSKLKELMSQKPPLPLEKQSNKVKDVAIFGNMASATLITGYPKLRWKENIHLVKMDNNWQIINVFWEFYPREKK